jgi:Lrp/AsnC family leucine-responsive transcriptional regulator
MRRSELDGRRIVSDELNPPNPIPALDRAADQMFSSEPPSTRTGEAFESPFFERPFMDKVDLGLLAALEENGRQSFATLAERARLSKTSAWSRVQSLEESGAIQRYKASLDPLALGLRLTAHVHIMIDFAKRDAFEKAVLANPVITDCFTMAGEADYLLKIVCADVSQLDELLRHNISMLPGVQRSTTMIAMKAIKQDASLVAAADRIFATAAGR